MRLNLSSDSMKPQRVVFRFFCLSLSNTSPILCVTDGSAIFKGCFHRPDDIALALPLSDAIQNMSVDKCVDMCTQKVRPQV